MIEQLFEDITNRLSDKVTVLRWVDLDFGQLEIPEESYPCQFPCALVDFPNIEFSDETRGNQQGLVNVQVRLGLDIYEDYQIVDGVKAPQREIAFQRLQIINQVHAALHGWEGDYFNPLVRYSLQSERRDDGIKVFAMLFRTSAKDDSAAHVVKEYTGANLSVKVASSQ